MADSDMDIIEGRTLSGVTIRKTTSNIFVLRYVEIYTFSILGTTLGCCEICNPIIDEPPAEDTKIHECRFTKPKMQRCKLSTSLLALRKFPLEIRALIFQYPIPRKSGSYKTPLILAALRGDSELYHEAIRAIYRQN